MDKTVYYSTLYDYYGGLLTENQRDIFEDYYFENLTLQEIADNNEISKNAVHKTINTITKKLDFNWYNYPVIPPTFPHFQSRCLLATAFALPAATKPPPLHTLRTVLPHRQTTQVALPTRAALAVRFRLADQKYAAVRQAKTH